MLRIILVSAALLAATPVLAQTPAPKAAQGEVKADPATALLQQARTAASEDDFAAAETAYRQVLELQTSAYGPTAPILGDTLLELALIVSDQQRFDEATALFRRAAPIVDAASDSEIRARAALYRGMDAANRRDYATALRYIDDAVAARQADVDKVRAQSVDVSGSPPVVPAAMAGELARALKLKGEMLLRLGDVPGAQAAAERALYLLTEQRELPLAWRPQMITLMGDINSKLSRTPAAEKQYLQALEIDKRLFGDNAAATIAAELKLGAFYAGEQVYDPAIANYRAAFAGLDHNPIARASVTPGQIIPFLDAASAVQSAGKPDKSLDQAMFAAVQLIGGGVEGQTIARVAARRAAGDPALAAEVRASEDATRAESKLRADLALEHARAEDERQPGREKALADALPGASQKAAAAAAKLRTDFPLYARLAAPTAVTLEALQKALHPREAFVSFLVGISRGYVVMVTKDALIVRPTAASEGEISTQVAAIRATLAPRLGKLPDFNTAASFALYRDLLAPVEAQLAGMDHLLVATSGDLSSLPFALLLTEDMHGGHDYVHAPWLARKLAISSAPSPTGFIALRTMATAPAPRPVLLVGNPAFDGSGAKAMDALATSCQGAGPVDAGLLRAMPPLPETAAEMQAVARDLKAMPGDLLTGAGASEAAVRAKPLDQYEVLYFATHGLLPGELHCQAEPGLVLSPPSVTATTTASDGLLTASEVTDLRLNAALVVLSACNTAAAGSTSFGGAALEGLADAFFDAGARAVLGTHWEVPSAATTSLMIAMFDARTQNGGKDTAQALRQAQLDQIARPATAHPYDWAGFTLMGDGV